MGARKLKAHRELQAQLPEGYTVGLIDTGSGHPWGIIGPDGQPLRDSSGKPVRLATSPSDKRFAKNTLAMIRRCVEGGK